MNNILKKRNRHRLHILVCIYDILLVRNRAILTELDNIITSILFYLILIDGNEINFIIGPEHFTKFTVADVIAMARIKILQHNNVIYILIRHPITKLRCGKNRISSSSRAPNP